MLAPHRDRKIRKVAVSVTSWGSSARPWANRAVLRRADGASGTPLTSLGILHPVPACRGSCYNRGQRVPMASTTSSASSRSSSPGAGGVLGQLLGQAAQGLKDCAQRIDQTIGISGHTRNAVCKASGQSSGDLSNQLKDHIPNHQMGAGAVAGGLGAIVLATRTGRTVAAIAVKLGGST